ncbi:MAG: O-antigen ligase family protein [Clostridia bacterium]|nr:O-antigen ligase family protein [Clostridia bacterium]
MIKLFQESKTYQIIKKIYLFFLIPFRETFVYKLFMTDLGKELWESSLVYKLIVAIRELIAKVSGCITQSVSWRWIRKTFSKTTLPEIISTSKILGWLHISGEGYSLAFFVFLLLLFLAGILPTMAVVGLVLITLVFSLFDSDFKQNLLKTKPIFTDALVGLYLISLIWGLFLSKDPGKFQIFLVYFVFVGLYYGVRYYISTERRLILSVSYFTLSGIFVCGYGFLQYITGSYETTTWTDTQLFSDISGRIYSTFQNPNVFGEYLLFLIPLSIAMFLIAKNKLHKVVYGGCVLASLACLILTYSRGCWLGLIAGMGLFLLLLYKKTLIPLFFLAPFSIFVIPESIINRFLSIGNLKDGSTAFRVYVWRGTVDMLKKLWPTGAGLGNYSFEVAYAPFAYMDIMAPHSHSLYFHLLSETGLFGFLAFVFLAYFILRQLFLVYKNPKSREMQILAIALVSGFVSFLIQGFFDNTFYNYRMYMLFFALLSVAASLYAVGGKEQ